MHEKERNYATQAQSKLAEMPSAGCARVSAKGLLLEYAERLRRKANQIEGLAYAIEHVGGDAEATLHGLLSGEIYRN